MSGKVRPIYIMGCGGVEYSDGHEMASLVKAVGQNTGNLVFQRAAADLVDHEIQHIGLLNMTYREAGRCDEAKCVIFPAANHLRLGADWSGLCGFLEKINVPLIVLGLGAQAETGTDAVGFAEQIRLDASAMRLVRVLKAKAALVTVRGSFTEEVCWNLGLTDVQPLACPSLMKSGAPLLGKTLQARLSEVADKQKLGIGVTASAPLNLRSQERADMEQRLVQWAMANDGQYIQQSGGDKELALFGKRLKECPVQYLLTERKRVAPDVDLDSWLEYLRRRGRVWYDVDAWQDAIQSLNLTIGMRLHGNMIAIGVGVPGVVITHDSRTNELVEAMRVPSISISSALACASVGECAEKANFDAVEFDRSRHEKAQAYVHEFDKLDIACSAHLLRLAGR